MSQRSRTFDDMTWWGYVQRIANGHSNVAIASRIDISPSSVSRWSSGGRVDPEQAAAFARAYDRPVLEAFIAAGFLTPEDADERPSAPPSLASLSDDELLAEVRRRMQRRTEHVAPLAQKSDMRLAAAEGVRRRDVEDDESDDPA